jgi:hypothetical protein
MSKKTSIKTGNRRLLALAKRLSRVPRKRFDYGSWVGADWKGKADLSCGTTACALGWGTTMPALRRLGLHLAKTSDGANYVRLGQMRPRRDEHHHDMSLRSASVIFGVTPLEAAYLFMPFEAAPDDFDLPISPSADATPSEVADHIRRFVASRS